MFFFDCYQTLVDIVLFDKEEKKVRTMKGWKKFVKTVSRGDFSKISRGLFSAISFPAYPKIAIHSFLWYNMKWGWDSKTGGEMAAAQLTKGIYGHEFDFTEGPFGLSCGQMRRSEKIVPTHNSGWYNRAGEKLGFGDLSAADFRRISSEINEDEIFIILSERDSFWNFVERPGIIGARAHTRPDVNAPGTAYVAAHCNFIVTRNRLIMVRTKYCYIRKNFYEWNGLTFEVMSCDEAERLIVAA